MQLSAFLGDWLLSRQIEDRRSGQSGRFDGAARFRPAPDGLAYEEHGWLTLGASPPLRADRAYRWQMLGDRIAVRFADGRFFHDFPAGASEPEAWHDCPPDFYRVRYDFRAWPAWRTEWRVTGPRKDHILRSDYRPAGQGSDSVA